MSGSVAVRRRCWSSAARTCRARAHCSARSASTRCWRRWERRSGPTRFACRRSALGATLKIEDSLQSGHSRFYSEILRIRGIVETARGPRPALFLLDEILHGTNSHDRRIGAAAIVHALVEAGAIGLVTTHDLALTELVAELDGRAANVHFADRIEDGRMVFDYRMRSGVVERSNALALMRAVGLDV